MMFKREQGGRRLLCLGRCVCARDFDLDCLSLCALLDMKLA